MIRYFKNKMLAIIVGLLVVIPTLVSAEEAYEQIDFRVNKIEGEKAYDTDIRIYASISSNPNDLTDRTEEFDITEKEWGICADSLCLSTDKLGEDAIFEEGNYYSLKLTIKSKNFMSIDAERNGDIRFNGTLISELGGFTNVYGSEVLTIETNTNNLKVIDDEKHEIDGPLGGPDSHKPKINSNDEQCIWGFSVCCTSLLGVSVCIWLAIAIVLLLLIIVILIKKVKKSSNVNETSSDKLN